MIEAGVRFAAAAALTAGRSKGVWWTKHRQQPRAATRCSTDLEPTKASGRTVTYQVLSGAERGALTKLQAALGAVEVVAVAGSFWLQPLQHSVCLGLTNGKGQRPTTAPKAWSAKAHAAVVPTAT